VEVERIIAWNTVSEMAQVRLGLRRDTDSEDFEEHLLEVMEGMEEGVGGSGVSTGNEGRGRETGPPKLKEEDRELGDSSRDSSDATGETIGSLPPGMREGD
jgi:hypothetical protein